jgi:D-xylose transport system permease protein
MSSTVQPSATEIPETPLPQSGFEGDVVDDSVGGYARAYLNRVRGGDLGALPAVAGIVVLAILFTALRPDTFPTPLNITNLLVQAVPIILLAMGLVFVLLLGEIDLSAGVVSGVCAAVMAVMMARSGFDWWWAVLAAVVVGTLIGLFTGVLVSVVRIPSFVVTLALFLTWQGVILQFIGEGGTLGIRDETLFAVANGNLSVLLSWVLFVIAVGGYAAVVLGRHFLRLRKGLVTQPTTLVLIKVGAAALLGVIGTVLLTQNRSQSPLIEITGVPFVVPIVLALLVIGTYVLDRTSYGRHIYAVGGNAEAARRAGINVPKIRASVFIISGSVAAVGAIVYSSKVGSVDPTAGGGTTLLFAVGAAVIGGTSLFGGKGRVSNAVIGGLVLATVTNGLGLLRQPAAVVLIVTGLVLLLAASVDALSRRRSAAG